MRNCPRISACIGAALLIGLLSMAPGRDMACKTQIAGQPIRIEVLVDNYAATPDVQTDWGLSFLVKGTEKTILFDTGAKPEVWLHNVEQLQVDLSEVEQVVISHDHIDHTGGLGSALQRKPDVTVFLLSAFSKEMAESVRGAGARVVAGDQPVELCKDVFVSGELGAEIKEQALVMLHGKGLIVLTGCAHPGIVEMLKAIKERFSRDIFLVLGGFHLYQTPDEQVKDIIARFRDLGVVSCGTTHCSGDRAIAMFREAYGSAFVPLGVGRILEITEAGVK